MILLFVIIQVYDVTAYVEEHPGGDAILNNAGDDSTDGFFGFVTYHKMFIAAFCPYCSQNMFLGRK